MLEILFYLFLFLKFNNMIDGNHWIAHWKEKLNIRVKYNDFFSTWAHTDSRQDYDVEEWSWVWTLESDLPVLKPKHYHLKVT